MDGPYFKSIKSACKRGNVQYACNPFYLYLLRRYKDNKFNPFRDLGPVAIHAWEAIEAIYIL